MDSDEFDALFEPPLSIRNPHIPGEVQQFGWLILAKRCRQLLATRRVFFLEQFLYLLLSICMTNPHSSSNQAWSDFCAIVNVVVLSLSAGELLLYCAGHGILPQTGAAGASNWKVMSILFVWSPLRLRPRLTTSSGDVGASFNDATPLLSNHIRTMELLVVLMSITGYILPSDGGYARLKYLHGLRSLRLVTSLMHMIPVTEYLARTFQDGIVLMVPAGVFLAFFFVLFGVAATDQLRGSFRSRCVTVLPRLLLEMEAGQLQFNFTESCFDGGRPILDTCIEVIPTIYCSPTLSSDFFNPNVCTPPAVCRVLGNPYNGYSSFDNIFVSWLTMIRISSLSNWNEVLYGAWGSQPQVIVGALFVLFIIISSFVVLNFIVAILSSAYNRAKQMQVTNHTEKFLAKAMENLRIGELLWWNFPSQVRHHLTTRVAESETGGSNRTGGGASGLTQPFFMDYRYIAARDLWLVGLVVSYCFNGSGVPAAYVQYLSVLENVNLVVFTVDIFFSLIAAGSLGLFGSRKIQQFDSFAYFLTILGFNVNIPLSVTRCLLLIHNIERLQFVRKRNLIRNSHAASFPAMAVVVLLCLMLFVTSGVAVQLFSLDVIPVDDGNYVDPLAFGVNSFDSFALSLTNMIRFVTADSWELIVYQAMDSQSVMVGLVFFLPAYILFTYMFHALFSAVVIAAFEPSNEDKIGWQKKAEELDEEGLEDVGYDELEQSSPLLGSSFVQRGSLSASSFRAGTGSDAESGGIDAYRTSVPDTSLAVFGIKNKFRTFAIRLVVDSSENDELRALAMRKLRAAEKLQHRGGATAAAAAAAGVSFPAGSPLGDLKRRLTNDNVAVLAATTTTNSSDTNAQPALGRAGGMRSALSFKSSASFHSPLTPVGSTIDGGLQAGAVVTILEEPPKTYGNAFQLVVMLFVLGSCLSILFDPSKEACSHLDAGQNSRNPFNYLGLEVMFATIFSIEMILKMVAHGVLFPGDDRPWYLGPTYFRDVWNVADFLLLLVMYIAFFYPTVAALRLMRILRPLRVIRRVGNMKLMVRGLFLSLPTIAVVVVLSVFFLLVYAIIGVGLFKDLLYYCTTNDLGGRPVISKNDCQGLYFNEHGVLMNAVWTRYEPNFDDVPAALSYLVQIASMSHWTRLVNQVISINGLDMQPVALKRVQNVFFFFSYILIVQCFVLNIVIGVILAILDELRGILFLTVSQRDWQSLKKVIVKMKPLPPQPRSIFPWLQRIVLTAQFELVVNAAVFVNIIFVASVHYGQTSNWDNAQFYANSVFTFFFALEMTVKMISLRLQYLTDPWNRIDMFVVIGSLFEFIFEFATSSQSLTLTSVARGLRVLRVFRSVKRVPVLRSLFLTLMESLAAILSLVGVIVLIVSMYALVGMALFGNVKYLGHISRDANFRSLTLAWFTVFRMLTLDGWNGIMDDLNTYSGNMCNKNQVGLWYLDDAGNPNGCGTINDCSSPLAQVYFFSFYVVGAYLLLNVVIAILLHNFRVLSAHARAPVQSHDLDMYQLVWRKILVSEGVEFHSESFLEEKYLPKLIRRLFTKGNRLVYHPTNAAVHIHPYMTARSRANYAQFLEELDELEAATRAAKMAADTEAARVEQIRATAAAAKAELARKKKDAADKQKKESQLRARHKSPRQPSRRLQSDGDEPAPHAEFHRRRPQAFSRRDLAAIQTANAVQFASDHHHHHHHRNQPEDSHGDEEMEGQVTAKQREEPGATEPGTPLRPEGPPYGPSAFSEAATGDTNRHSDQSPISAKDQNVPVENDSAVLFSFVPTTNSSPNPNAGGSSDGTKPQNLTPGGSTKTFSFTNILLALSRLQVGPQALTLTQQRHRQLVKFNKCCKGFRAQLLRALARARHRLELKRADGNEDFFSPGNSTVGGGSSGTPQLPLQPLPLGAGGTIPSFRSVVSWVNNPDDGDQRPQSGDDFALTPQQSSNPTGADGSGTAPTGTNAVALAAMTRRSSALSGPIEAEQTAVYAPTAGDLYSTSYPSSFRGLPLAASGAANNTSSSRFGGGAPSFEQPSMSAFLGSFSSNQSATGSSRYVVDNPHWALRRRAIEDEELDQRHETEAALRDSLEALLRQAASQLSLIIQRHGYHSGAMTAAPRQPLPGPNGFSLRRVQDSGALFVSPSPIVTRPGRNPIAAASTPSQMCPLDHLCLQYSNIGHCSLRRHTCRDGSRCSNASSEHRRLYVHVASFDSDEIQEVFIDFTSS